MNENNRHKHILIVEDEGITRLNVFKILNDLEYQVSTADDGQKAFNIINEFKDGPTPIDLLLTDINLPNMTGLELIHKLKNSDMSLPTLVFTGFGNKELVIELLRSGCGEYIDKPFEPDDLAKRVALLLDKKEKVEEEKVRIDRLLESYKANLDSHKIKFELFEKQIGEARKAYQNLIQTREEKYNVNIAFRYQSIMELGGDFFEVRNTPNGCDIVVADVAGHDIGASFHTVMVKAFFDENCRRGNDGTSFFKLLNRQLTESGKNERFVTAVFLRINLKTMRGEVLSAAHPSPLKFSSNLKSPQTLCVQGDVLGLHNDVSFDIGSFTFNHGDKLFLYTDGLVNTFHIDPATGKRKRLGDKGFMDLIIKHNKQSLNDMIGNVWSDIMGFCHHKYRDDLLLLGIEIP